LAVAFLFGQLLRVQSQVEMRLAVGVVLSFPQVVALLAQVNVLYCLVQAAVHTVEWLKWHLWRLPSVVVLVT
jgi:hypothetical protein